MTLEEAINHAIDVAGEYQQKADEHWDLANLLEELDARKKGHPIDDFDYHIYGLDEIISSCREKAKSDCTACGEQHGQIADWLTELKELRKAEND